MSELFSDIKNNLPIFKFLIKKKIKLRSQQTTAYLIFLLDSKSDFLENSNLLKNIINCDNSKTKNSIIFCLNVTMTGKIFLPTVF